MKLDYNTAMISCVLLSAGESQRFGSPKALGKIGQLTAIETIQRMLLSTSVSEIVVVLGSTSQLIAPYVFNHKKVRLVYNKDYKLGQTSSFQTGIISVDKQASGIMLLPVDCPLVDASTIERLIAEFNPTKHSILVPQYQGHKGHPPVFNAALTPKILSLTPTQGINTLFSKENTTLLELNDPGILKTFNTPDEFDRIKSVP